MANANIQNSDNDVCEACGAAVPGGRTGCETLFHELIAREFGDYRYGRIHRLTVDAYSLQHPEQYMRSGKSFAAHLTGICAALEREDTAAVNDTVQRWLSTNPNVEKPAHLPQQRGGLTVAHVHAAATPEEHVERVRQWARSVWEAWSEHHALARQLIAEATNAHHNPQLMSRR